MCKKTATTRFCLLITGLLMLASASQAAQWSHNEVRLKYGDRVNPFSGDASKTTITTLEHASGWKYGENFYFVDFIKDDVRDGFNDNAFYGEWYSFLGTSNLFSVDYPGPIRDFGVVAGVNASGEARTLKYLPGVQINWDVPGFNFFNTLVTGYIDDSEGLDPASPGNAPKEDDSFMVDVAWQYPFTLGSQKFTFEGHAEYIDGRDFSAIPGGAKDWVLAQPQLRWDVGHAFGAESGRVQTGVEWEYWNNKLGTGETDSNPQFILVWIF